MCNEKLSNKAETPALNKGAVSHSFINNGFQLSTDYKLLYELIFKGHRIPAWLVYTDEYEEPIWDLVEVKKAWQSNDKYSIGTRGIGYESFSGDFKWFEAICTKYSLHFVVPQNCG